MKQIKVDVAECTGCGQCALTCSFKNVGSFDLSQSSIRILQWEEFCLSVPLLCQQCSDTPCITVCPVDAIQVHPDTGAIVIDNGLCTQCHACMEECRYQEIHLTSEGFPLTCDLCGGSPKCVAVCYTEAISFEVIPVAEKEPFKPLAGVLVDRSMGKLVEPPMVLRSKHVS
jgi:anaerobic carbon-monoxide dehydrogenase iron sulfur subunit